MKVLLIESECHLGDDVVATVERAGHEVLRCHDPVWQAFPCVGMQGQCPMDADVDVVVVARNRDNPTPSNLEDGARCAARAGVPIVLVGPEANNPYADWTVAAIPTSSAADIVAVIERVVLDPHAGLSFLATSALVDALGSAGIDSTGAHATVTRRPQRNIVVQISVPSTVDLRAVNRAAVRAAGAVRRESALSDSIDVCVEVEQVAVS